MNTGTPSKAKIAHLLVGGVDLLDGLRQRGLVLGLKDHIHNLNLDAAISLSQDATRLRVGASEQALAI